MPLTTEERVRIARDGMKTFEKNWAEINEPDGYVAIMAREKGYTSLVKREIYTKGLSVLRDLTKNHFTREKPGFFARLFRTKAAREYKAEREEMNRISKQLEEIKQKDAEIPFSDIEKANKTAVALTDISINYMIRDRSGFDFSSNELDTEIGRNRRSFEKQLNVSDPTAQDTKDQIVCDFLKSLDNDFAPEKAENVAGNTVPGKADPEFASKVEKDIEDEPSAEDDEPVAGNENVAQKEKNAL